MPSRYKLQRRKEQGGRWRKVYKGRYWYRAKPADRTWAEDYSDALEDFDDWKREQDAEREANDPNRAAWQKLIENVSGIMSDLEAVDSPRSRTMWNHFRLQRSFYRAHLSQGKPCPVSLEEIEADDGNFLDFGVPDGLVMQGPAPWERFEPTKPRAKSLRDWGDDFLKEKLEIEKVSAMHYEKLAKSLEEYFAVAGTEKIDSASLLRFRKWLDNRVADPQVKFGDETAAGRMRSLKTFTKWLYEREIIADLPRVHSSRALTIAVEEKGVTVFTDDELRAMFEDVADPTRLYMLLMLNCGFRASDIADLRPDHVDLAKGTLTKKRTKTAKHAKAPTVCYRLWPDTLRLLKKLRATEGERLLTTQKGDPLVVDEVRDGKRYKIDHIHKAFARLRTKLANRGITIDKAPKHFRPTASTRLESHPTYGRFAQHFLAHAPDSIAAKHYVIPDQDAFDEAVLWLGDQLPLKPLKP